MLVLCRKQYERILIGDNIAVAVKGKKKGQFLICVEAPRDVPILREELREKINDDDNSKSSTNQ